MTMPETFAGNTQGSPEFEVYMHTADAGLEVRIPVTAGEHEVGVSFVSRRWEQEGVLQPPETGWQRSRDAILQSLIGRLKSTAYLESRPELLSRPIKRPVFVFGIPRTGTTLLSNLLAPVSHLAQIHGLEAGLHVYLELHSELESTWIVQEAYKRGVIVAPLSPFYLEKPDRNGLLLGYGGLTLSEISQGATILAEVIASIASKVGL